MSLAVHNVKVRTNKRPTTKFRKLAYLTGRYAYLNNNVEGIVQGVWRHYAYVKVDMDGNGDWVNTRTTDYTFGCEMSTAPRT